LGAAGPIPTNPFLAICFPCFAIIPGMKSSFRANPAVFNRLVSWNSSCTANSNRGFWPSRHRHESPAQLRRRGKLKWEKNYLSVVPVIPPDGRITARYWKASLSMLSMLTCRVPLSKFQRAGGNLRSLLGGHSTIGLGDVGAPTANSASPVVIQLDGRVAISTPHEQAVKPSAANPRTDQSANLSAMNVRVGGHVPLGTAIGLFALPAFSNARWLPAWYESCNISFWKFYII